MFCGKCGTNNPDTNKFCKNCGKPLKRPEPSDAPASTPPAPAVTPPPTGAAPVPVTADRALTWILKIPLITNYLLIRDMFFAFIGGGFLFATILVLATGVLDLYMLFAMIAGGLFLLCLIVMFVLQVAYGGGFNTLFSIGPEGVYQEAGKEVQALDRFTVIGSAAGGSMGGTGAGMIATSQEDRALFWKDVRYIRVYSRFRVIVLRSKYLISPIGLYCSEENFPVVLDMVKQYAPKTVSITMTQWGL